MYISKTYKDILTQNKPLGKYRPLTQWECWREGETEGILIGGNLHLFNHLCGTEYFPSLNIFNNAILFWEEEAVTLYNIARSLYQLKYWGILGRIRGMIIGKITAIKQSAQKEITDPSPKELVLDILKDYDFPILAGVDFGHYTVNLPMPVGLKARYNSEKLSLELLESAVV